MGLWHSHDGNHFLLKIYRIDKKEFFNYYYLNYVIRNNLISEEDFFRHVWEIVQTRIKNLKAQDPFSSIHAIYRQNLAKLQQFQKWFEEKNSR